MQTKKEYNQVVEANQYTSRVYNIIVHPFTDDDMMLYEEGMRAALKERPIDAKAVFVDFSEIKSFSNFDDKTAFDMLQFISFQCLRCENIYLIWGDDIAGYLKDYTPSKHSVWKISGSTIKKLLDANTDTRHMKEFS